MCHTKQDIHAYWMATYSNKPSLHLNQKTESICSFFLAAAGAASFPSLSLTVKQLFTINNLKYDIYTGWNTIVVLWCEMTKDCTLLIFFNQLGARDGPLMARVARADCGLTILR
jgi:hypothetical protein